MLLSSDSDTPMPHYHPISGVKQGRRGRRRPPSPASSSTLVALALPVFVCVSRSHASDTPHLLCSGWQFNSRGYIAFLRWSSLVVGLLQLMGHKILMPNGRLSLVTIGCEDQRGPMRTNAKMLYNLCYNLE